MRGVHAKSTARRCVTSPLAALPAYFDVNSTKNVLIKMLTTSYTMLKFDQFHVSIDRTGGRQQRNWQGDYPANGRQSTRPIGTNALDKTTEADMKIFLSSIGTRCDIQPFMALGQGLQAGHQVAFCTAEGYRAFVEDHGVPCAYMDNEFLVIILAAAINTAVYDTAVNDTAMQDAAAKLGAQIRAEDGVAGAVTIINKTLEKHPARQAIYG
jgi:hypothetical protein